MCVILLVLRRNCRRVLKNRTYIEKTIDKFLFCAKIQKNIAKDYARESGARVYYYVRPPYGYEAFGRSPVEQCREFDRFFTEIADREGAVCAYVNRAFEYAIENTDIRLWGDDNAHTSDEGAYLAVCVIFATVYGKSASLLDENGIDEAKILQEIADKIVFG